MSARGTGTWLLVAAGVVVLASLVAAVAAIGTPGEQRLRRMDERRERDLAGLRSAVETHYRLEGRLPASLAEVSSGRDWERLSLADPQTGAAYGYRVVDARRFELCARFARASRPAHAHDVGHPAGRHCLRHAVTPPPRATVD